MRENFKEVLPQEATESHPKPFHRSAPDPLNLTNARGVVCLSVCLSIELTLRLSVPVCVLPLAAILSVLLFLTSSSCQLGLVCCLSACPPACESLLNC
jgi:hypothetical protein